MRFLLGLLQRPANPDSTDASSRKPEFEHDEWTPLGSLNATATIADCSNKSEFLAAAARVLTCPLDPLEAEVADPQWSKSLAG